MGKTLRRKCKSAETFLRVQISSGHQWLPVLTYTIYTVLGQASGVEAMGRKHSCEEHICLLDPNQVEKVQGRKDMWAICK